MGKAGSSGSVHGRNPTMPSTAELPRRESVGMPRYHESQLRTTTSFANDEAPKDTSGAPQTSEMATKTARLVQLPSRRSPRGPLSLQSQTGAGRMGRRPAGSLAKQAMATATQKATSQPRRSAASVDRQNAHAASVANATTSMAGSISRLCWKNPYEVTTIKPAARPARRAKSDAPSRNVANTAATATGRLAAVSVSPPPARATATMVHG